MCNFCEKKRPGAMEYLVNSVGGYDRPELWACVDCMRKAEAGSKLAELRDGIYAEDFH